MRPDLKQRLRGMRRTAYSFGLLALFLLGCVFPQSAAALNFIQQPELAQPGRGTLAGSLHGYEPDTESVVRGGFSLPLHLELPVGRAEPLVEFAPTYSPAGPQSEWGLGWQQSLRIERFRDRGELSYDEGDRFFGPWGRFAVGSDGKFYPEGAPTTATAEKLQDGWKVRTPDGRVWRFSGDDATTTRRGSYAWNLSSVSSADGQTTSLTWQKNPSGKPFLVRMDYGRARFGRAVYQVVIGYKPLAQDIHSFLSGPRLGNRPTGGSRRCSGKGPSRWSDKNSIHLQLYIPRCISWSLVYTPRGDS